MGRRPLIGISSNFFHADPQRPVFKGKVLHYVEEKMSLAVYRGGGIPVGIPDVGEAGAEDLLEPLDGLLLAGGADVSPTTYGETPLDPRWAGDAIRDAYEARLLKLAMSRKMPVIGICRGIQLINAALGGTLYQDITTQRPQALVHRDWDRYEDIEHTVRLDPATWVSSVYGESTEILVNTIHHQGIHRLAPGFVPTAHAPDGVIEAMELDPSDGQFVVGIQWHPEWLDGTPAGGPHRASGAPIFDAFIKVCADQSRSA